MRRRQSRTGHRLRSHRCQSGFTLLELLVSLAIIVILMGLLFTGVQRARQAAARVECANRLHQIGFAAHNCNDTAGALPPAFGWFPSTAPATYSGWGSTFFHLLPYLEEGNFYKRAVTNGPNLAGESPGPGENYYSSAAGYGTDAFAGARTIPAYLCPSDPSIPVGPYTDMLYGLPWGVSSYAGNFLVFGQVDANFNVASYQAGRTLANSFPDGTSNTILFGERYAVCVSVAANLQRACLWAWWESASVDPGHDYYPFFALETTDGSNVGPASIFQIQPTPGNCDPSRCSTGHLGGMQVVLADGSVRLLSSGISGTTWWAACTPDCGETLANDW